MVEWWTQRPRRWSGSVSAWLNQAGVFGRTRRRRNRTGTGLVGMSLERLEDRALLSAISELEPNSTALTAQAVVMPTASILTATDSDKLIIDGNLTTNDTDYYQFTLNATSGVFFDIDSRDNGLSTTLDSVLTVFNSSGATVLGSNDSGYDFEGFAIPATSTADATSPDAALYLDLIAGTYLVRVSSAANTTGAYQLKLLADSNYSASAPVFDSNISAADALYLDFDGHSGSDAWGTYNAAAFDFNGTPSQFSPAEQLAIKNAWRTVSEDYSPFALNVTTAAPAAFGDGVAFRMVITNSDSTIIGQPSGNLGNSFVGSYATGGTSNNVGFVFAENFPLYNSGGASGRIMARAAEQGSTVAHEFGHSLGLNHYQSQGGVGIGSVFPEGIMASPDLGLNREIWRTGTDEFGNAQDDMSVVSGVTNTFGYRADDHGNVPSTATVIGIANGSGSTNGVISNLVSDSDYFQFTASGTTRITANVDEYVNDLDTVLNVYNFNGGLLASSNPSNSFDAAVSLTLSAGTYFAEVRSHGSAGEAGQYTFRVDTSTAPTMSINDVSVTEGNSGTVNATFTVSLTKPSDQTVVVTYATANGTAVSSSDYVAAAPTPITFAPGVTSRTISVMVNGDTTHEATETFFVNLSNPINVTIADLQGVGTIVNDDAAPGISINDVSVAEGNSGTANATFTVTLDRPSSQTITVQYATANGTATTPLDYNSIAATTLTFNPGTTSKTITVYVNGDVITESDETFFVDLTNPTIATIADSRGVGTIIDNDAVPPTISITDVTVTEGDSGTTNATFTVSLSAASGQTVSVNYATANDSAVAPSDYTSVPATTVTFSPGVTSRTIDITIIGDTIHELTERFFVNLSSAVNATISDNQGIGTITNNDPVPQLSINDVSVVEGNSGTKNATFTVTLSRASSQGISVEYATADGTAKQPQDYTTIAPSVLTFAAGVTSRSITVQVNGDVVTETDETFFVNLSNPTIATIADAQGQGTIIDDDQVPPTISINDVTVTEGDSGTSNANFTVTLSLASVQTVTVQYSTSSGTATAAVDYTTAPLTTITFAPGTLTQTVAIPIVGDTLDEFDETYFVNLSNAINSTIADNQAAGTILDNDANPTISISDASVVEGNA
ncbi:MAG: pre-peptidase C-terminal domain-containing protein, partial [Planctomycetales bacterium]|nr:pre-peptidase C-terminal domain-containing protein [Planctomycetales bacterium]